MNSGKVVLGVLAGLAAGAALGVLFAPDKGSATRKKISDKGTDFADGMGAQFNDFMAELKKTFETIKEEYTQMTASNGEASDEEVPSTGTPFRK